MNPYFNWKIVILFSAVVDSVYGPNNPNVVIDVNNIGSVFKALGDLEGLKKNYKQTLEIYLEYCGENHPKTVIVQVDHITFPYKYI